MTDCNKALRGTDWNAIFKRRPDLEPPGFRELFDQIQKEQASERTESDS